MIYALIGVGYLLMVWQTAAALFAADETSENDRREAMGLVFALSAIPLFWLLCPFMTGFYEHGWNWKFASSERHKQSRKSHRASPKAASTPIRNCPTVSIPKISDHRFTVLKIYKGEGCAICGKAAADHSDAPVAYVPYEPTPERVEVNASTASVVIAPKPIRPDPPKGGSGVPRAVTAMPSLPERNA